MKIKTEHISEEWNEGNPDEGGDGHWIALMPGWKWDGDPVGNCHTIHEDTKRQAHQQGIMRCDCKDCAAGTNPQTTGTLSEAGNSAPR